jgi:hypothetical protein
MLPFLLRRTARAPIWRWRSHDSVPLEKRTTGRGYKVVVQKLVDPVSDDRA